MATGSVRRRDQPTNKLEGAEEALPSEATLSTPTQDIFLEGSGPKTGANRCQSSRYPEEEACSSLARKGEYVEFNTGL
jgi:hypothetical protein